ncbi:TetR/AcrR family transcriptional regulator [Falsiroseomonas oryziterrae]|uniref:TetR/AcrR family transcriptional regulator n=1 Tax=Falsiroseomonas oryziterrae TaxID=2911368 RepID=UPI001F330D04|nr:TetR/AcrR family transcriptional regulator [Roseomonas sp. NPKOSM-4]
MDARRAELGRARRDRTRGLLVEAALRVFARMGPDAPNVDDFTAEAGVARGTFYNYFDGREDLLVAVATLAAERMEAERMRSQGLADPAERMACALRSYIRQAAADPAWGWVIVRIALVAAPLGPAMRANLEKDLADGIAAGRFVVPSMQAAQDLVLGAGIMGMRAVLKGDADPGHAEAVARMVLLSLGVADAAEVATRPLPGAGAVSAQGGEAPRSRRDKGRPV